MNTQALRYSLINIAAITLLPVAQASAEVPTKLKTDGASTRLLSGEFDASSRKARLEICSDLRLRVLKLLQYLPVPKPSDLAWINKERSEIEKIQEAGISSDRFSKLLESPEFQTVRLRSNLEQILMALEKVQTPKIQTREEILNWCIAGHFLTNNEEMDDAIRILIKAGQLPADLPTKVKLGDAIGYTGLFGWWGRGIQEHLVIPFLAGKIKS